LGVKLKKNHFLKRAMLTTMIICGTIIVLIGSANVIYAAPDDNAKQVCEGVKATGGNCDTGGSLTNVIASIVNVFSWVVGVVAVIMVIWGGFTYVTAAGDPQKAAKARSTILYAVVGLVVVALAQIIVQFVLRKVTVK
jgi:hypothetical protein